MRRTSTNNSKSFCQMCFLITKMSLSPGMCLALWLDCVCFLIFIWHLCFLHNYSTVTDLTVLLWEHEYSYNLHVQISEYMQYNISIWYGYETLIVELTACCYGGDENALEEKQYRKLEEEYPIQLFLPGKVLCFFFLSQDYIICFKASP